MGWQFSAYMMTVAVVARIFSSHHHSLLNTVVYLAGMGAYSIFGGLALGRLAYRGNERQYRRLLDQAAALELDRGSDPASPRVTGPGSA
jgi:hypothetical protein